MIDLVDALTEPAIYPWAPDSVQRVDTHLSHVFLAGERVLKIKRAVDYGFVDFLSLESRRRSCEDECRLNARLTIDVYLGVVPITQQDGTLQIDGAGEVVEWGTVMRRLPADAMLDARIRCGDVPAGFGQRLGQRLAKFHRSLESTCGHTDSLRSDSSTSVVLENLEEMAPFAGSVLDEIQFGMVALAMRGYVAANKKFLDQRVADGWIREGHGDLRAEHICLEPDDKIQIFDCVEFSKEIRCADIVSDLSFLLMDLQRLSRRDLASDVVNAYHDGGFELPVDLIRLYTAHRALVRAKVACLSMQGLSSELAAQQWSEANEYLDLATAAAIRLQPVLIAMTGLSGTGKSTVAHSLGRANGALVLASDVTRKQLAGVDGSAAAAWQGGIYTPEWTDRTYAKLLDDAMAELRRRRPVIVDATFLDEEWRVECANRAEEAGVPVVFVEVTCDPDVVARRISARAASGASVSDASIETVYEQAKMLRTGLVRFPDNARHVIVDTSSDDPVRIGPVLQELRTIEALQTQIGDKRSQSGVALPKG